MQLTLMIAHPKNKKPMFYFCTAKTESMPFKSLEVEFLNNYAVSKINQNQPINYSATSQPGTQALSCPSFLAILLTFCTFGANSCLVLSGEICQSPEITLCTHLNLLLKQNL
mgnify:CR=1 FL=1